MTVCNETISKMAEAGIGFAASVRAPGGSHTVFLKPQEVQPYLEDRDGFAAAHFGASRQQYLEWIEADGSPRCGATIKNGRRCRNIVSGGIQREFSDWIKLDGGYCSVHGGE